MSSISLQKSVSDNVEELKDYVGSMTNWQDDMKNSENKFLQERQKILTSKDDCKKDKSGKSSKEKPKATQVKNAEDFKAQGNSQYQKGHYDEALENYKQGIILQPSNHILFANMAMVYLKLEKYDLVEENCNKSIEIDPKYVKAYLRRATARTQLNCIKDAIEDYKMVLKLETSNKVAKTELQKLQQSEKKSEAEPVKKTVNFMEPISTTRNTNIPVKFSTQRKTKLDANCIRLLPNSQPRESDEILHKVLIGTVANRKDVETVSKLVTTTTTIPVVEPLEKSPANPVEKALLNQPKLPTRQPRTSHQFMQDTASVKKNPELATAYLMSLPVGIFKNFEIEVDTLVQMASLFASEWFDVDNCAKYMSAVTMSKGFFLSLVFLESKQKQVFQKVIEKIRAHADCTKVVQEMEKAML